MSPILTTADINRTYFPALTGVRALAAYLVYLHHTNPFSNNGWSGIWQQLLREFHIGVSIFFVLSGFLIAHRYVDFVFTRKFWFGEYMLNRMARVYPMYFLLTTFTAAVFLFLPDRQVEHPALIYLMNISFLRGFFDDLKFTLIGPGWSLTVEECFYVLAPIIFLCVRRTRWYLLIIPVGLMVLGYVLVESGGTSGDGYGFFSTNSFMLIYTFFGRCVEFFFGIGLALYIKRKGREGRTGKQFTYGGVLLLSLLIIIMSWFGEAGKSGIYTDRGIWINNFLLPVPVVFLFYGLIVENSLLKRILSSPILVLLGKTSYTFYLIHVGLFYVWINQYADHNYVIVFLGLNLLAIVLWYAVEEPVNKWLRRLWARRAGRAILNP